MSDRHPGLIPSLADCYVKSAIIILDRHHQSPQEFIINSDNNQELETQVIWNRSDDRTRSAFANSDDATRDGAYAFALAATEIFGGLVAIRRAEKLTGADYYIAPIGSKLDDLENAIRLEVSGTELSESDVKRRLIDKVNQAANGKSDLPALAAVVGFKVRLIMLQTVEI